MDYTSKYHMGKYEIFLHDLCTLVVSNCFTLVSVMLNKSILVHTI